MRGCGVAYYSCRLVCAVVLIRFGKSSIGLEFDGIAALKLPVDFNRVLCPVVPVSDVSVHAETDYNV